jgi:Tfp pilus assembly protein PilF
MRGWAWWYRPASLATRQEAQRAFEKGLEIDPGSMNAKIGLATALASKVLDGLSSSPEQDKSRAEQMLVEALARDDNNSMAHWAMALVRRSQNRLSEAKIESETAISLDGNNAFAFLQLGLVLMFLGQPEAGIPHIEKAIRLDPRNPNMVIRYWALGACHLLLRHLDEATELLRRARAVNPRLSYVHFWLAGALGLKGDLDEARGELAESIKLQPELNSLARIPVLYPWNNHPEYRALAEKTFYAGVRRAGFPDE